MASVKNPLFARYFDRYGALIEFRRALRQGGQLRFYEHVRSRDALFARFQQTAYLLWPRLMGGCHVQRQTRAAIEQVFTIEACRGFRFPPSAVFSPPAPRILGTARKTDSAGRAL
jgi:hypothetical protein